MWLLQGYIFLISGVGVAEGGSRAAIIPGARV